MYSEWSLIETNVSSKEKGTSNSTPIDTRYIQFDLLIPIGRLFNELQKTHNQSLLNPPKKMFRGKERELSTCCPDQRRVSPDARTRGVSLFRTRTVMVTRVRRIPRLEMLMGRMEKLEPSHMYWTCSTVKQISVSQQTPSCQDIILPLHGIKGIISGVERNNCVQSGNASLYADCIPTAECGKGMLW